MRASGIRSYHRPSRLEEALSLRAQGMAPMAGGTRLLAEDSPLPNVLDLSSLQLDAIKITDGDLVLGAMTTLQAVIDSPLTYAATAGLLPVACRAHSASRMVRNMATVGGEAVHAAHDSDVAAALLALNAVFVVAGKDGPLEIPALRFLKNPQADLAEGALLESIVIPGPPDGAALERASVLPSAPSLLSVAAGVSFAGDTCTRARIAISGLATPPGRILEAEARVEGTPADAVALGRCVDQVTSRAAFRDDSRASAGQRRSLAAVLTLRALRRAIANARTGPSAEVPRLRPAPPARITTAPSYFTSGRTEIVINGERQRPEVEARTTLLELLRNEGFFGVKQGCDTGECGACVVLVDGRPINSCLTLALRVHGKRIQTIEGLGSPEGPHPIQTAFLDAGAIQCGFCTPGMQLCAKALLDAVPRPSEAEVRDALGGSLCRCTGYAAPVRAVMAASRSGQ